MTMKTLRQWTAKRAGARITIQHADGKVPRIDNITCRDGRIVATAADGQEYELAVSPQLDQEQGHV